MRRACCLLAASLAAATAAAPSSAAAFAVRAAPRMVIERSPRSHAAAHRSRTAAQRGASTLRRLSRARAGSETVEIAPTSWKTTLMGTGGLVAVKFHAAFCGPCKIVAPIYDEFAAKMSDDVVFAAADTTTNVQLLAHTMVKGVRVTKIPTVVLYKDAQPVGKLEGLFDEHSFAEFIESHVLPGAGAGTAPLVGDGGAPASA